MFFRVGKFKMRLFDGSAILAPKPGNLNNQFALSTADRECFESACNLAKLDDTARFTIRTFEIIAVDRAMKNGLAFKKTVLKC